MKPRILILVATYLPGYKSGGPIRSISNLVESFGDQFDFRIITSDRDLGDEQPYPGIQAGSWTRVGAAQVLYLPPERQNFLSLFRLLAAERADCLYLNSFFCVPFSILPMLARATGVRAQRRVVLAPRGEFSPGALQFHKGRKRLWIELATRMGVYRNALWNASSEFEERDIRRTIGRRAEVFVSSPLSPPRSLDSLRESPARTPKASGQLRAVFLSRICPKKNLLGALDMIKGLEGEVVFDIYGPKEDEPYWATCESSIDRLPGNVKVQYRGILEHASVQSILSTYDVFLFPTMGENFGHVIVESLLAGCPVLISDQTPWRNLRESAAGWDLPLDSPEEFTKALRECMDMDEAAHGKLREGARQMGLSHAAGDQALEQNRQLFVTATAGADQTSQSTEVRH